MLPGKILIEIRAEGCEDHPYMRISSVKVNSIERSPMGRGMNVVILDSAGNYLMSKNFDTADPYHAIGEGKRMSKFLDELPSERLVCVASLESVGKSLFLLTYAWNVLHICLDEQLFNTFLCLPSLIA